MSNESFWSNDITVLLSINSLRKYLPSTEYTLEENLNAIMRLGIIISVILCLFLKETNYLWLILLTSIITYMVYKHYDKKDKYIENFKNTTNVVYPTENNPFMNVMEDDYISRPNRTIPKDILCDPEIKKAIEENFNKGLSDIDVFGRKNSQRQYYTVPVTTIPNKQKEFAEWLYKTPPTCKENNGFQCVANNTDDLRQSSSFRNPLI